MRAGFGEGGRSNFGAVFRCEVLVSMYDVERDIGERGL